MRPIILTITTAASLVATACATTMSDEGYRQEFDRLEADCRARGGILTPIPGATRPEPAAQYACEITGGASRVGD